MLHPVGKLAAGLILAVTIAGSSPSRGIAPQSQGRSSIEQAISTFLSAFNNLDWRAFRACFSDTATVFQPAAPYARRVESPGQFEQAWLTVFDRIRKSSGRASAPYMDLRPADVRIEQLSEDVGLVTFHLIANTGVNRRTLVFKRYPEGWKIVHLHASTIAQP